MSYLHIVQSYLLHVPNKLHLYVLVSSLPIVDVSSASLPMQVPPGSSAILPMDLRVVDHHPHLHQHHHHHHQQPSFGLVPQPHPTAPVSTACPTSSEPGRGPVISKWGPSLPVRSCG